MWNSWTNGTFSMTLICWRICIYRKNLCWRISSLPRTRCNLCISLKRFSSRIWRPLNIWKPFW
jgi:hypothetical protein